MKNIKEINVGKLFISKLHKHIVEGLTPSPTGERDKTLGTYRNHDISISNSPHKPPSSFQIDDYMDELFIFCF